MGRRHPWFWWVGSALLLGAALLVLARGVLEAGIIMGLLAAIVATWATVANWAQGAAPAGEPGSRSPVRPGTPVTNEETQAAIDVGDGGTIEEYVRARQLYADSTNDGRWRFMDLHIDGATVPLPLCTTEDLCTAGRPAIPVDIESRFSEHEVLTMPQIDSFRKSLPSISTWNDKHFSLKAWKRTGRTLDLEFDTVRWNVLGLVSQAVQAEWARPRKRSRRGGKWGPYPLRKAIAPSVDRLTSPDLPRLGGVLAVVALADGQGGYNLLLQKRSKTVVDGRDQYAVVPKGFHTWKSHPHEYVHPSATLTREFAEEMLGVPEARSPQDVMEESPWLAHPKAAVLMSMLDDGAVELYNLGLAFNLVTLGYEIPMLFLVRNPTRARELLHVLRNRIREDRNSDQPVFWETRSFHMASTTDMHHFKEFFNLETVRWTPESFLAISQALSLIRDEDPDAVKWPIMTVELASPQDVQ